MIEEINISELKENPNNPRTISEDKFAKLVKSIKDFPEMLKIRPLVIDAENFVLGGNMRLKALFAIGYKKVPIIRCNELTDAQKKQFIITDNSSFGQYDWDMIANEGWTDLPLSDWGLDLPDFVNNGEATEDDYEIPENVVTDIVSGDLFEIGQHRLLCGDSTKAEDVEKLMGGEKANICITDPPYSVDYKSRKNNPNLTLQSYIDPKNSEELLFGFMNIMPTDCLIMTYADKHLHEYVRVLDKLNFETIDLCIWVKQNFCFWAGARYQQKHELIFYARKKSSKFYSNTPSNQSTIFEVERQMKNDLHPTIRPLVLWLDLIKFHSKESDLIYDPFLGSGTTMVGTHQLNRKVYGIEISPQYCAVIIDRMKKSFPDIKIKRNNEIYNNTNL